MRILNYVRKFRVYLVILGVLCLSYGIYQKYWYSDLIEDAVQAIETYLLQHGCESISCQ